MSLLRLKRQDFHTCICGVCLILINSVLFYCMNGSVLLTVVFAVFYIISAGMTGALSVMIRKETDLLERHLLSSVISASAIFFWIWDIWQILFLFFLCNLAYGIWLIFAKKWMRHEISPGWTMLLYDSRENLERAKMAVESRKELMIDTCHCVFGGADIQDGQEEKGNIVENESELDDMIRLFRIPQMLICLEKDSDEVVEYCKKAGITAFVKGKTNQKGQQIDKEGLIYIRPQPGMPGKLFGKKKME